jgi:hypothetical protein
MRRRVLVLVLLVASPVAVWFFGVALPHDFIDPGVEDFDGAQARMA